MTLLKEYRDVFAWTYEEMPGLDPSLVVHRLSITPGVKPVKQGPRIFRPEVEVQVKEEIEKLLRASFIKPIEHPHLAG